MDGTVFFCSHLLTWRIALCILYMLLIYSFNGIHMDIVISNANNAPIYEQIYLQIKNCILSGGLQEGDMLPSIRALAKDLRISVITTKRAYDELERDGYIYTVAGKGCFVAEKNTELIREEHLRQIEEHLRAVSELAGSAGLSREEAFSLLEMLWEND